MTSSRSPLFINSFLMLLAVIEGSFTGEDNVYTALIINTSSYVVSVYSLSVTLLPVAAERIEAMELLNFLPNSEGGVTEVTPPVSVV